MIVISQQDRIRSLPPHTLPPQTQTPLVQGILPPGLITSEFTAVRCVGWRYRCCVSPQEQLDTSAIKVLIMF